MLETLLGEIHHCDCVKGLGRIPDQSVDLVFADPPFNIGYKYDEYDDRLESKKYLTWSAQWMSEVYRVLKSSGAFWLAIGDEYAAELKLEASKLGFSMRNWVIWYYTFGVHCHSKFTRSHAHLFYFTKDPASFTFNFKSVAVPSARQLVYNDKRSNPEGRSPDDTWILRPQDCTDGFQADEDVWYFPRVAGTFKERAGFHGCQMPEQLLGRIIRACTNESDVVLDPFSGSSTTLVVAKKLGRKFLGFELSKEYAERGAARLTAAQVDDDLDGSAEPRASTPSTYQHLKNLKFRESTLWESELNAESQSLIDAFANTHRGFSVDRIVADPILNEDFQKQCDRINAPGTAAERNRFLFRLRKSGRLKNAGIETSKTTKIDWTEVDPLLHASEIAWSRVGTLYNSSLDEILCDPRLATEFDRCASQLAPGFTSLQYRWAAIKLRKEAGIRRGNIAGTAENIEALFDQKRVSLTDLQSDGLPNDSGVYSFGLDGAKEYLYVGETQNLSDRLRFSFDQNKAMRWPSISASEILVQVLPVPLHSRLSNQLALLQLAKSTQWNCRHLYAAPTKLVV